MNEPFNVLDDNYSVFVPIEDTDLMKSVDTDENGDYIVKGVMTSDAMDEEDDSISPNGMDCSYFLEKGWIKYEHGNKPEQFIGEPLEVKVGNFKHPTTNKSVNGIYVKGRLFAHRNLAKQAVQTITDLAKSHTKRRMGWSIEGNVKERDRKSGKIVKSVLRNVVLTMNPVNTTTWAELSKSFAKNHELTIDMDEPVAKAMDIASAEPIIPQSLEGAKKKKDPQQEWIDSYRALVKKLLNKSFRTRFIANPETAEASAYVLASSRGMDDEEANAFASYIAEKHTILKSLGIQIGGASMADKTKEALASLLDESLEELNKSLEADVEFEDDDFEDNEDLEKSMNEDDDEDDHGSDDEEDKDSDDDGDDDKDEEGDDDHDAKKDGKMEKSVKTDFAKSLAKDEGTAQAFEVSDFLLNIADEIGFSMGGFEKSLMATRKQNEAIVKSLSSVGELVKSLTEGLDSLKAENEELKKSLDEVLNRPVGRRSVVNGREVQTLSKSLDGGGGEPDKKPRTRFEVSELLYKSMEAGEISGDAVLRFEGGVPLDKLGLPQSVIQKLI